MKIILIILSSILSCFYCQFWYEVTSNLQNNFSNTDGWSTQNTNSCNTSICDSQQILGGSKCLQDQSEASQTFSNIPQHFMVKISFTLWFLGLDPSLNDQVHVNLGSQSQVYSATLSGQNYLCVSSQDQKKSVTISKTDSNSSITVTFFGQVSYQYDAQGWGISDMKIIIVLQKISFSLSVLLCNPTCNLCDGVEAFSCTSCWPNANLVIYQGSSGFCQCNPGYFSVTGNMPCSSPPCFVCNQCDSTCSTCTAADQYSCITCANNYYKQYYGDDLVSSSDPRYQKSLCQSNCFAPNYYKDISTQSCLKCSDSCLTCNGQLDSNCITCATGLYLDGTSFGNCVSECSSSYYKDDATMKCLKCNSNCLECTQNQPNFCSQCVNNSYLTISTGLCVSDCGQGQWGRNTDWSCQLCDTSCFTCSQSATYCTSCSGSLYLYDNKCLLECPEGYYKEIDNTCQQCDQSCKTCNNSSNQDCLSCSPSYGYLKNGMCIQCPVQFFGDNTNQTCQPCHSTCYSCDAGTSMDCLSCSSNFLQNRECVPICSNGFWGNNTTHECDQCDPNCLTCQPYGPSTSCLSCSSPLFLKNFSCINACNPVGEYGDLNTRECTPCDNICYTCSDNSSCLSCTGSLYFHQSQCLNVCPPSFYGLNNICQTDCPDGMYPDNSTNLCKPCNSICPTCIGSSISECKSCLPPYYLDGNTCVLQCPPNKYKNDQSQKCDLCDLTCLTCNGGTNQDCASCSPTFYFGNNQCFNSCPAPYFSSTVDMQCVLQCPEGYWGDINSPQRLCQHCHPQCQICFGGSLAQCTKCTTNFFLFQNTCDNCPINYFPNIQNRKCEQCFQTQIIQSTVYQQFLNQNQSCQSCNGPSSSNCLSCNQGYYYLQNTNTCYSICPIPYFSHFTEPNCLLSCPVNYIKPLYGNIQTRECEICDESCQKCTGPSNLNCLSCASGYYKYLPNNSCVSSCPNGTYEEIQSMQCLPCDKTCATCYNGTSISCLSCLLPSVLYNNQCIQDCPNSMFKDLDLKQCVTDCTSKFPNKYANKSDMTCQYCNPYCQQCTGPLSTQCKTCKNPYLKFNSSCISQCQQGTYFDSQKQNSNDNDCKQCNPACLTCYGSSSNDCITCNSNFYSLVNNGSTQCLSDCPNLYVKDPQKMNCSVCPQQTFYYLGQCQKCHYSCKSCFGSFQNQCLSCQNTRGNDSSSNPLNGICSCKSGYLEAYQSECEEAPKKVTSIMEATQALAISGTSASILIGIIGRNMFFIYNILESAQFISFLRYVNINYPLNLQSILNDLYLSQISSIINLNSDPTINTNNQTSSQNSTQQRILEWNSFESGDFIFEVNGKNQPLWKSFFFLILLNVLSWVLIFGLYVLATKWKIKYNQAYLIEKIRCWTSYSLPVQIFLRTSMEAIFFIVLCFKQANQISIIDWIFCLYFLILLISIIIIMFYQSWQPIKLDEKNQPVVVIIKLKKNKVSDEQTQTENNYQTYPHPFRTLWQFTKLDKISRNYFLINLISKIFIVVFIIQFIENPPKQILSIAIVKTLYFMIILVNRPMVNFQFNFFTIFNEILLSVICYLVYFCSTSSNSSQNSYGYAILIILFVLFLINLVGSLITLVILLKGFLNQYISKNKNQQQQQDLSQNQSVILSQDKSQQIDILNDDQKLRQKKLSHNFIDNSSTIQIQRDIFDDFDQSKTINNQTLYQYDYENPFQFLDLSCQDIQNNQKSKRLRQNSPNSNKFQLENIKSTIQINKEEDQKKDFYPLSKIDNKDEYLSQNEIDINKHSQNIENCKNKVLKQGVDQQDQYQNEQLSLNQEIQLNRQNQQADFQKDELKNQNFEDQIEDRDQFKEEEQIDMCEQTVITQFVCYTPTQINYTITNHDINNTIENDNNSIHSELPQFGSPPKKPGFKNTKNIDKKQKHSDIEELNLQMSSKSYKVKKGQKEQQMKLINNEGNEYDKAQDFQTQNQQEMNQQVSNQVISKEQVKQEEKRDAQVKKMEDFLDSDLKSINKSPLFQAESHFQIKQDQKNCRNVQKVEDFKNDDLQQFNKPPLNEQFQQLQIKYDQKQDIETEENIEIINVQQQKATDNSSFINQLTKNKSRKNKVIQEKQNRGHNKPFDKNEKASFLNEILQQKKNQQIQPTFN